MAYKFKPGDVIIGNALADSRYSITNKGWIGQVMSVYENSFCARTLYKNDKLGTTFPGLAYDYFDLLEPVLDAKQIEQMKMML